MATFFTSNKTVTTCSLRSIIVFAIVLCCFQSCNYANASPVNCEQQPYHKDCRGMMTRRSESPGVMRAFDCDDDDCRLSNIKFLVALLNKNLNKGDDYDYYPPSYDMHHKKRTSKYDERRQPMGSMMKNLDSDY